MYQIVLITHVIISVILIALVLVTQTRGSGMGAIGSGASQTVFGSQGSTSFLFKLTSTFAALFFATSLGLSFLVYKQQKPKNTLGFTVNAPKSATEQEKPKTDVVSVPTLAPTEKNDVEQNQDKTVEPQNKLDSKEQNPENAKKE